jgi:Phosphatidylglycerol lysyltransferase, C-terminal
MTISLHELKRRDGGVPAIQIVSTLVRRIPFTLCVIAVMLAAGVATGALWSPLRESALAERVAYGLPALEAHRWWTPFTGAFFGQVPLQYLPVAGGFLVLVGFAELRLGTRRAAVVTVATQLAGVLGAAGLLWIARGHGWPWADRTAQVLDVGFSAGALGVAAAATATLRSPWRGRLRAALLTYGVVFFVYAGVLWDLEHLIAILVGLAVGPRLVERRINLRARAMTRHEYRLFAAGAFAVSALAALASSFSSSGGPLTVGLEQTETSLTSGFVFFVIWLLVANGLRKGRRRAWRFAVGLTVVSLVVVAAFAVALAVEHHPGWPLVTYTGLLALAQLLVLLTGRRAFRNPSRRRARRTAGSLHFVHGEDERSHATALLRSNGTINRMAWMTTWPENRWFFGADGSTGYVAYRIHAGVAIGLCDPVAARARERSDLLATFAYRVQSSGLLPCLFSVTQEAADHARSRRWRTVQVAEEAVIDLNTLKFTGKAWQDVRTALNQAGKQGLTHRMGPLARQPRGVQVQVRAISEQWVGDKGLPEMGFTLGGLEEAMDPDVRVGLVIDSEGTVHGVTSWMPAYAPGGGSPQGWTLDVMRRLPDGFRYTMEFLIASACLTFKEEGAAFVSLSGVPLARAGTGPGDSDRGALDAFLSTLGARLEPYYGFRSLQAFKAKFQPSYAPLYLVFPDEGALPRIGLALSRAYLPEAGVRDLLSLAQPSRQLVKS